MNFRLRWLWVASLGLVPACGTDIRGGGGKDLTFNFGGGDGGGDGGTGGLTACNDYDPSCTDVGFGPSKGRPFPLSSDMPKDPNESESGVVRDKNGYLTLSAGSASFDFLWLANTSDLNNVGTISKMDSKALKEVARYLTVTCNSLGGGVRKNITCDANNVGCCAMDSYPQYQNRKAGKPSGMGQQVQTSNNLPSRTAIDFNGDAWVSNRAFGGQSSVTKLANDKTNCIDRNGNGKIDTSSDVNGNGVIEVDCNGDGTPDDIDNVKGKPCSNGMAQEYYGLDDECVLFTTNTDARDQWGRPLSLGPGAQDFGPSDAWAGLYNDGRFFRIDGTTGLTKDDAQLPNSCHPYGLVIDSTGFGWSPNLAQAPLCYFNTKNTQQVGTARVPTVGQLSGYGVALDRDQNIWVACLSFGACRYTPDRKNGFASIGNGYWTMVSRPGANAGGGYAIGVAVDSRTPNLYFAWVAGNNVISRIPGSGLPLPMNQDVLVDGAAYPTAPIDGSGKGVGVDRDQNLWNVSQYPTSATRVRVDQNGTITPPDLTSNPMGQNLCPAGDRCRYKGNNQWDPSPYTYSDFTGFGLRNFTRPTGTYTYIQKGCPDGVETKWVGANWDADVPLNTTITFKARSSKDKMTWGAWTPIWKASPADLVNGMPLVPNGKDSGYLQVEFDFATSDKTMVPKLKAFDILYECVGGIG